MLHAEQLKNDSRIKNGKIAFLQALKEHISKIDQIKPPNPDEKIPYQKSLEALSSYRGAKLFFPYIGSGIGNGSLVELLDGSIKWDMITGIGVHYFGHCYPPFLETGLDAALSDTIMQGNLQQNLDGHDLASLLCKYSGMPHCFLTTSGVMANENGLKVAFQKNSPATRILAFDHCFAGRSLTFSQVTDKPSFREGLPSNVFVDYIPYFDPKRPEESLHEAKTHLIRAISRYPKGHALMMFELILGEGGFYPGSKEFFEPLMKICKEHHIAVFADEVQSFGRTPSLFAYQHFGLSHYVDIVTIGKMLQVGATLYSAEYCPKPNLLSQTFVGSTSALKGGKVVIEELMRGDFFGKKGRNQAIFEKFEGRLKQLEKNNWISGPYGIGAMIAFTPFDGSYEKTMQIIHSLYEAGVITFIAGTHPFRIRMLVPGGVITDSQIDSVMDLIASTLEEHVSH